MTQMADLEDALDAESPSEHLRVVTPIPPKKKRPDKGDFIIYGGWFLAVALSIAVVILALVLLLR